MIALLGVTSTFADDGFVRTAPTDTAATLQTADATLRHASGVTVTLIATVHLAEPAYFAAIARDLSAFDVVVHEGVAARRCISAETTPAAGFSGLVRQADHLRFTGDRFVRADADPARLAHLLAASPPAPPPDRRALAAAACAIDQDPHLRARVQAAYAITARDAHAIEAVRHRLARGDRSIALVYGAAHGHNLLFQLDRLGFIVTRRTWRDAFRIDSVSGQRP